LQHQHPPPPPPAPAPHVRSHGAPPTHKPIFAAAVDDRTLTLSFSGKLMACETKQVPYEFANVVIDSICNQ